MKGYFTSTRAPAVAAVVTLPLLLLYNIGLLMPGTNTMNAADLLTNLVMRLAGLHGLLALNGILVIASIVLLGLLVKRGRFRPLFWGILCVEGLAYGLALGHLVIWVMGQAHLLGAADWSHLSIPQRMSIAAGAGYWEELVFRLGMIGLPMAAARWIAARGKSGGQSGQSGEGKGRAKARSPLVAVALTGAAAALVSSFLFSLAHYLGSESFEFYTFWYRAISGLVFALVFLARGFAVAAYTHFLYDVVVMVF